MVGNIGRGMTSLLLDSTHSRTTSGVACHHLLWAAQTVGRLRVWHSIIALGQHKLSAVIGHGITSPPLDSTYGRTTSSVACHYRPWKANTIERHHAWHHITALGQLTWSKKVGHDMPSPPLDNTHGRTTSGVACHHRLWAAHTVEQRRAFHAIIAFGQHKRWNDVGRGIP